MQSVKKKNTREQIHRMNVKFVFRIYFRTFQLCIASRFINICIDLWIHIMLSQFVTLFPSQLKQGPSPIFRLFCCCGIAQNVCAFEYLHLSVHAYLFLNLFAFSFCCFVVCFSSHFSISTDRF